MFFFNNIYIYIYNKIKVYKKIYKKVYKNKVNAELIKITVFNATIKLTNNRNKS